jgi:hypothetical protein
MLTLARWNAALLASFSRRQPHAAVLKFDAACDQRQDDSKLFIFQLTTVSGANSRAEGLARLFCV